MTFARFSLTLALTTLLAASAHAEEEFDLSVSGSKVTVSAKGSWHINTKYPWKLTVDGKKVDKSQFSMSEHSVTVTAPKGTGELRGGVCSADQCVMIKKTVTVN